MPTISIENFQLYYETCGTGEPLVLISGFASGAWNWFKQIGELSKHFRVITFDPRGVANSPVAEGTVVSIETIAEDIAALLDELQIETASILGVSFGGFVAQEFALNYPERLNKLILACTSFGGKNHVAPSMDVLLAFATTSGLNSAERIRKFMKPAFSAEFNEKFPEIVEQVCQLREHNIVPENVYLQQLTSATTFDLEPQIGKIVAETLILSGNADAVVPIQNSINLAKLIPSSQLKIIENGGHLCFIEKAEEFNQLVSDFVFS